MLAIVAGAEKLGARTCYIAETSLIARRRCDILVDSEPPVCDHCKKYGFECTFFLPITETRFKKKNKDDPVSVGGSGSGDVKAKPPEEHVESPVPEQTRGVRIDGKHMSILSFFRATRPQNCH